MTATPVVLILAAGRGEQFFASGGRMHKLEALLAGKAVLSWVIDAVNDSGLRWHLVNPGGGTAGMGDSIALGVQATPDAACWLVLPGDLPLIKSASLRLVAEALQDHPLVVPHHRQQSGHPVGFGREHQAALLALTGDQGARSIVQTARRQGRVRDIHLEDAGVVQDIDTLSDLAKVDQMLSVSTSSKTLC